MFSQYIETNEAGFAGLFCVTFERNNRFLQSSLFVLLVNYRVYTEHCFLQKTSNPIYIDTSSYRLTHTLFLF